MNDICTQQNLANICPAKISIFGQCKDKILLRLSRTQRLVQCRRLAFGKCVSLLIVGQIQWLQVGQ